jgi:hypothetical protein
VLPPQHPVHVVLGPEQAHLIGAVPHHGGSGSCGRCIRHSAHNRVGAMRVPTGHCR